MTYRLKDLEEANLVNDRSQLARAEEILRRRILDAHMREGVTVRDPASYAHRGFASRSGATP